MPAGLSRSARRLSTHLMVRAPQRPNRWQVSFYLSRYLLSFCRAQRLRSRRSRWLLSPTPVHRRTSPTTCEWNMKHQGILSSTLWLRTSSRCAASLHRSVERPNETKDESTFNFDPGWRVYDKGDVWFEISRKVRCLEVCNIHTVVQVNDQLEAHPQGCCTRNDNTTTGAYVFL